MEGREEPGKRFLFETDMTSEAILTALTHIPKRPKFDFEEFDKEMKAMGNPEIFPDASTEVNEATLGQQIIAAGRNAGIIE